MIPLALTILALAGRGFLAAHAAAAGLETAHVDAAALCANEAISLTPAQVSALAPTIGQRQECAPEVQAIVRKMADIIHATRDDACNLDAIALLKGLHRDHLAAALADGSLPASLERFILSYALRMSQRCKDRMVAALAGDAHEAPDAADFGAMREWTAKGSRLDDLLRAITRPGTLVLPSDLAAILPGMDEQINKLAINSAIDSDVQTLKAVCERRFAPVYKRLVEPVAELARAGFDYPDAEVTGKLTREQIDRVDEWARIVFTCEVLNMVETFKKSSTTIKPETMLILDEESLGEVEDELEHEARWQKNLKTIHYEPKQAKVKMGDFRQLDEQLLNRLATDLVSHADPFGLMKEKLREKAIEVTAPYLARGDLNGLVTCSCASHEKALCGRRRRRGGGCGQAFTYLFFAAIISIMMMMIAGGN